MAWRVDDKIVLERVQRMERVRARVEQRLAQDLARAFRAAYQDLYPHLVRLPALRPVLGGVALGKQDAGFDWEAWRERLRQVLHLALLYAAHQWLEFESEWWLERDVTLDLTAEEIVNLYETQGGRYIESLIAVTQRQVAADIHDFQTSQEPFEEFAREVEQWFSKERAQIIAATEGTRMQVASAQEVAYRLGLSTWMWWTQEDERVCLPICAPRHGVVYDSKDPYPPGHVNCRCFALALPRPT